MANLTSIVIAISFSFATGFFTTLSYVEKPVWGLVFDSDNPRVTDENARLIHAELKRIINIAPPTMATVVSSGTVLVLYQMWQQNFGESALTVAVWLFLSMGYVISQLRARIAAVKSISSDGDIDDVREGLGGLVTIHHMGLIATSGVVILQTVLVVLL
ncbi:hypothetical protein [Halocatena marina]|uniref:DUF1772 domain-containing protein n=1 Tax=Halocatena marina TaxID=2934937 RepID=A0ABD5YP79_9EURY|nr:hypothetical protein [Halocatena marina]